MSDKKVATTVYLTVDQRDKLRTLSGKTRVPASEYIRQGVDMVLSRHEHLLPGQLTLLSRLPDTMVGRKGGA